jgi:hypothetical protein
MVAKKFIQHPLDDYQMFQSIENFIHYCDLFGLCFASFYLYDNDSNKVSLCTRIIFEYEDDPNLTHQMLTYIVNNGVNIENAINEIIESEYYNHTQEKFESLQDKNHYLYTYIYDILYFYGARFNPDRWNEFCDTKTENMRRDFGPIMEKYLN